MIVYIGVQTTRRGDFGKTPNIVSLPLWAYRYLEASAAGTLWSNDNDEYLLIVYIGRYYL